MKIGIDDSEDFKARMGNFLQAHHEQTATMILSGGIADYPEYRFRTGYLQALHDVAQAAKRGFHEPETQQKDTTYE